MKILESYLVYLDSIDSDINEGFVGNLAGELMDSVTGSSRAFALGTAGITAATLALKAVQLTFSKARKKCGSAFLSSEGAPARAICVDKEKIKLFKQKLLILMKADAQCDKVKNPEICHSKLLQKINGVRVNLKIAQDDHALHVKELTENFHRQLNEGILDSVAKTATKGITFGFDWFLLGAIVDKSLFIAWRAALGLFSSASRRCGTFKQGDERAICMSKIRLQALLQKKSLLDKITAKCNTGKNPDRCKDKIANEVEKNDTRVEMEKNNIIIIGKRIRYENMKEIMKKKK